MMADDMSKLTDKERDALASTALETAKKSRQRAKEYRERKRSKGMVQISIWVPSDRAKSLKKAFEDHVAKNPDKKDAKKDMSGGQSE
jgi:vacuolar-type H+-ATPase subunit I/STV1